MIIHLLFLFPQTGNLICEGRNLTAVGTRTFQQ